VWVEEKVEKGEKKGGVVVAEEETPRKKRGRPSNKELERRAREKEEAARGEA